LRIFESRPQKLGFFKKAQKSSKMFKFPKRIIHVKRLEKVRKDSIMVQKDSIMVQKDSKRFKKIQ
jgi:hypothetical protein